MLLTRPLRRFSEGLLAASVSVKTKVIPALRTEPEPEKLITAIGRKTNQNHVQK